MNTVKQKIQKHSSYPPTEFEERVVQVFLDLEKSNQEIKRDLKNLYITSAFEVDVSGDRKAVVIQFPYKLKRAFRKIHLRLVRELEKIFGKDVVLVADISTLDEAPATMRPRPRRNPRTHNAMLEDLMYPAVIVGKRHIWTMGGRNIIKVFLDETVGRTDTEHKLDTISTVYLMFTSKRLSFEYTDYNQRRLHMRSLALV